MKAGVVIVAAGRGERAGAAQEGPKQYRSIGGKAILRHTLERFATHPAIGPIVCVIHADDQDLFARAVGNLADRVTVAIGGATRQDSVLAGLESLASVYPGVTDVMIHDGVRPFVSADTIGAVATSLGEGKAAIAAIPVTDTLKRATGGRISATEPRDGLYSAQTPQGFPLDAALSACRKAAAAGLTGFTDDAAVAEWAGIPVAIVSGSPDNVKITWQRDIETADMMLSQTALPDIRTGNGYDVHSFTDGTAVTLCGVAIPHDRALSGHSDADVALHALTDALLATCGAGDIGDHFPPSDPQWRGAASSIFLEHAAKIVRDAGGTIMNADISLIAEAPKIGPHRLAMRQRLSEILAIDLDRCSVKATTNEKLGFVGRREGIAAIATATVVFGAGTP